MVRSQLHYVQTRAEAVYLQVANSNSHNAITLPLLIYIFFAYVWQRYASACLAFTCGRAG